MTAHLLTTYHVENDEGRPVTLAVCVVCRRGWPAGVPLYIEPCTETEEAA
jgi:hypothetical protein